MGAPVARRAFAIGINPPLGVWRVRADFGGLRNGIALSSWARPYEVRGAELSCLAVHQRLLRLRPGHAGPLCDYPSSEQSAKQRTVGGRAPDGDPQGSPALGMLQCDVRARPVINHHVRMVDRDLRSRGGRASPSRLLPSRSRTRRDTDGSSGRSQARRRPSRCAVQQRRLNFYRDGRDSVAPHNDRLHDIREGFPIPLLSLGATRRMTIRAKRHTSCPARGLGDGKPSGHGLLDADSLYPRRIQDERGIG